LNDARFAFAAELSPLRGGLVFAPCCPKRMSFGLPFAFTTTACDLPLEWLGVRMGLSNPANVWPPRLMLTFFLAQIAIQNVF
tara:strand:- start:26 stop:271 length:246 start_codon:yes stop_codon:yes gene_type:complete